MNDATTDADRPLRHPRPPTRPELDPGTAEAFARPQGVRGGLDPRRPAPHLGRPPAPRTDDPVLAEAFGRTEGDEGPLGRAPARAGSTAVPRPPDPWRDPHTPVTVGVPAVPGDPAPEPVDASRPRTGATRLGLREVLFDRRPSWQALAALGATTALVALVAGGAGSLLAGTAQTLTADSVRLSEAPEQHVGPDNPIGEVARKVQPAVVNLQVSSPEAGGEGSGIVIDPRGYIVTNNHVVTMEGKAKNPTIEVVFSDGQRTPGKVVGTDPLTDLAVVKVQDVAGLTVGTLGRSSDVQVGQTVVAFGSPLGLSKTVTQGIVSAVDRPIALGESASDGDVVIDAVQTDAAINPGNSGGPLVDATGAVVGINTSIFSNSGGSIGLGFAIPVDDVRRIATALIETGSVRHATIGVNARTAANGAVDGAEVVNVKRDSAGERAGLREGDVVTKVGDRAVHSSDELVVAVREAGADHPVRVSLIRDGRPVDLEVTPTLG